MTLARLKNFLLPVGFSVPMALMASLVFIGLQSMAEIQNRLKQITEVNNIKITLVTKMRYAARERTISLYRMIATEDPFDRDEVFLYFVSQGAVFTNARITLLKMALNAKETDALKAQSKLTNSAVDSQNLIVDLTIGDQPNKASKILYEVTVPKQEAVFEVLSHLLEVQQKANITATNEAAEEYIRAKVLMIIFAIFALILGVAVAMLVIRQTRLTEKTLYREKRKAEVTLHSIGDGVITTNVDGEVEYLNPVAEKITGCKNIDAIGQPLLKVFKIFDTENNQIEINPVLTAIKKLDIVSADNHFLFNKLDNTKYSLEHTAGPMLDKKDNAIGAVLVFRNVTDLRNMTLEIAHQAAHDSLTGLINRNEFEKKLEVALEETRNLQSHHILCYLDLDQFKIVNDTCGHVAGDELLKQLVKLMSHSLRKSDILARLGGDEFGILLNNCSLDDAKIIADTLRQNIKDFRFSWDENSFVIGASFGIVEISADCGTITDLLSAADSACYVSKDLGRDRVHIYKEDDEQLSQRQGEMQWLPRIQSAFDNNQFCLYCQKIMPLKKQKIDELHFEILIRLVAEDGSIIPPMAFIPAAERYNLMPKIDRWVIGKTFSLLTGIQDKINNKVQTWSINLSGQSICDDDFLVFIKKEIETSQVDPKIICFEITETAAVKNLSRATEFITQLKKIGCRFSLDDFGSGLSSFTYLKNLPVDYLKIDGSFVKDMVDDPIDLAMVKSINQIGHTMNLKTIAEFAENDEILDKLRDLGVDYVQGYGHHKPQSIQSMLKEMKIKQ